MNETVFRVPKAQAEKNLDLLIVDLLFFASRIGGRVENVQGPYYDDKKEEKIFIVKYIPPKEAE